MSQAGLVQIPLDIAETYVTDVGDAVPAGGILNIIGGIGITTSGSGNTVTINATGMGFSWNTVTPLAPPNPIQIVAENGYICGGVGTTTFVLPLAPSIGDTFKIFSYSSKFRINQNANQIMQIGAAATTLGVTGYLISNSVGDAVSIVYMGNNTFQDESIQGTLTVN